MCVFVWCVVQGDDMHTWECMYIYVSVSLYTWECMRVSVFEEGTMYAV